VLLGFIGIFLLTIYVTHMRTELAPLLLWVWLPATVCAALYVVAVCIKYKRVKPYLISVVLCGLIGVTPFALWYYSMYISHPLVISAFCFHIAAVIFFTADSILLLIKFSERKNAVATNKTTSKRALILKSSAAAALTIIALTWLIVHFIVGLWIDILPILALAAAVCAVTPSLCVLCKKYGAQYAWHITFLIISIFYTAVSFINFLALLLVLVLLGWYIWAIWLFGLILTVSLTSLILLIKHFKKTVKKNVSAPI